MTTMMKWAVLRLMLLVVMTPMQMVTPCDAAPSAAVADGVAVAAPLFLFLFLFLSLLLLLVVVVVVVVARALTS